MGEYRQWYSLYCGHPWDWEVSLIERCPHFNYTVLALSIRRIIFLGGLGTIIFEKEAAVCVSHI